MIDYLMGLAVGFSLGYWMGSENNRELRLKVKHLRAWLKYERQQIKKLKGEV